MTALSRQSVAVPLLAVALAGGALWCWAGLADARSAALDAGAEAARCRRLAAEIEGLRHTTAGAAADLPDSELTRRITRAASGAGFPDGIDSIEHQPPRRAEGTAYAEAPTRVVLRRVTLRQLVAFLASVTGGPAGPRVERLHLSAPPEAPSGELWAADLTLTTLTTTTATTTFRTPDGPPAPPAEREFP